LDARCMRDDEDDDDVERSFNAWTKTRDIIVHASLRLDGDDRRGRRVVATNDVPCGTLLCSIPKASCLMTSTSALATLCASEAAKEALWMLEEAALVACVAYERKIGSKSAFAGYLGIVPRREALPGCRESEGEDDEVSRALRGTSVRLTLEDDREAMEEDHARVVEFYEEHVKVPPPTLNEFIEAASLVASRAFFVDEKEGQGMVPFADMFNHRGNGGAHFDVEGCDAEEGDQDEYPDALRLVSCRDIARGEEVFNSFGDDHDNAMLYTKYGFVETDGRIEQCRLSSNFLLGTDRWENIPKGALGTFYALAEWFLEEYDGIEVALEYACEDSSEDVTMTAGLLALCYVATMCQDKPDEWWESEFSKEVDKMLPRDIFHRAPQVDDMKRIDEDILRELIAHRFLEFLTREEYERYDGKQSFWSEGTLNIQRLVQVMAQEMKQCEERLAELDHEKEKAEPGLGLAGTSAAILIRYQELQMLLTLLLRSLSGFEEEGGKSADEKPKKKKAKLIDTAGPRYGPTVYISK
jgi:N-lysine methyltransferase SETD6